MTNQYLSVTWHFISSKHFNCIQMDYLKTCPRTYLGIQCTDSATAS